MNNYLLNTEKITSFFQFIIIMIMIIIHMITRKIHQFNLLLLLLLEK